MAEPPCGRPARGRDLAPCPPGVNCLQWAQHVRASRRFTASALPPRVIMAEQCSYGAWPSPVSARDAAGAVLLRSATLACDEAVWWQEIRPGEGGRSHLLRASADGCVTDVVNDQTGLEPGVLLPVSGGAMVAASDRNGRLFLLEPGARPRPLTPAPVRRPMITSTPLRSAPATARSGRPPRPAAAMRPDRR